MKKRLILAAFCVALISLCTLCTGGISGAYSELPALAAAREPTTEATEAYMPADVITKAEPATLACGETIIFELSHKEESALRRFYSDDESVAAVDSGGRIDAEKEGKTTVTAEFEDGSKLQCEVTVTKSEPSVLDRFSTCIEKNADAVEKNKKSKSGKDLYEICVNRAQNCVTVYTYDADGKYTIPVRAMVCSTGEDNSTVTGAFDIYFKRKWHPLYQNVYGCYVSGISGDYLFHSVPYYTQSSSDLEVDEFNKLGTQASLGCVRLAVSDAKWIYNNCGEGVTVKIYDDDNPGPLGKPETIKITDKHCGWDPTDDNPLNPYCAKSPQIIGAENRTIKLNSDYDALDGVKATDTCSNDVTSRLKVTGNVVTSRPGAYRVTYSVTDALHRTASVDITVTVE